MGAGESMIRETRMLIGIWLVGVAVGVWPRDGEGVLQLRALIEGIARALGKDIRAANE